MKNLKFAITDKGFKIPIYHQKLWYRGRELLDTEGLYTYNLEDGSQLEIHDTSKKDGNTADFEGKKKGFSLFP